MAYSLRPAGALPSGQRRKPHAQRRRPVPPARECAKLQHILRHFRGVTSARLCPNSLHTISVEYDRDTTDAETLLTYIRALDDRATMLGL